MKYEWLDEFCLSLAGAARDYKIEWDAVRYMVGGKMFVLIGKDSAGRSHISVKNDPAAGQLLRAQFADIIPGYHMNKQHWSSIYSDGNVPDDVLRRMIDESHRLVLAGLSKKVQQQVLGE